MRLGIDLDPACKYPYEANNGVPFLLKDVAHVKAKEIRAQLRGGDFSLLAGCAPCQAFSTYNARRAHRVPHKFALVREFGRLVQEARPDLVTMENVPYLRGKSAFKELLGTLRSNQYRYWYEVIDARYYGVPQTRRRLVLLASRVGDIELLPPTHPDEESWKTVRDTIRRLSPISAGSCDGDDPIHVTSRLSELNVQRLRASKPGKSWREWPAELRADCHTRKRGKRYVSVYGRMRWNEPAPTVTTQCFGFGNGRFGHPSQLRAISLREAALLQTFPAKYDFVRRGERVSIGELGRLIGNAVPVRLAEIIGRSLTKSVKARESGRRRTARNGRHRR